MLSRNTERLWEERVPNMNLVGYQALPECSFCDHHRSGPWVCHRAWPGRCNQRLLCHWWLKQILPALILGLQSDFWHQFSAEMEGCYLRWSLTIYSLTIPKRWYNCSSNCLISSEVVVIKSACSRSLGWTANTAIETLVGITISRVIPGGFFSNPLIDESLGSSITAKERPSETTLAKMTWLP